MTTRFGKFITLAGVALSAALTASCGEFVRESRSPSQLVIELLQAAAGAEPDEMGGTLLSDVITNRTRPEPCSTESPCPTIYNDIGEATIAMNLRDLGSGSTATAPSAVNSVTLNRYRVSYRRADGRNTPGVDVPYGFDSAVTGTVPTSGSLTVGFDIVRHAAKREAPLTGLRRGDTFITTIADITFYGRDQAGNEVSATGSIGITFGNFADPD